MILALDTYYSEYEAKTVGVLFAWDDEQPKKILTDVTTNFEEYKSGQFYKRELPCILNLLNNNSILQQVDIIIVDGYVYTNNDYTLGLGGFLYNALGRKTPVIGVAKRRFFDTDKIAFPILRGNSKNPLYISSIGVDIQFACMHVQNMKGKFRIPQILKLLDQKTRELGSVI